MPHVIVKLYQGKPAELKNKLAQEIVKNVISVVGCEEKVVSVAFEEFDPAEWPEKVYRPDILEKGENLVIKPGYNPFQSA